MSTSPADQAGRARLRRLLPWHVNGSLPASEAAAVRTLLADDLPARREANELRALAEFVAAEDPLGADMERQIGRTRRLLEQPARARGAGMRHWRIAASLLVPLAGAAVLLGYQLTAPRYATRADTVQAPGGHLLHLRLQVDPSIPAAVIDAALLPFAGRRVDGPVAPGLYTVAVPPDRRAAAEQALRQRFAPRYLAPAAY